MPKTIRGTKDNRRYQMAKPVIDGKVSVVYGALDPRQMRCPHCNNLATNQPDGRGGKELRCGFCNRRFNVMTI